MAASARPVPPPLTAAAGGAAAAREERGRAAAEGDTEAGGKAASAGLRSHAHLQTLHPRPGGAAVPRPAGHEEARVRRRAVERLRGQGAARGEHRGGCPQGAPGGEWTDCGHLAEDGSDHI